MAAAVVRSQETESVKIDDFHAEETKYSVECLLRVAVGLLNEHTDLQLTYWDEFVYSMLFLRC